MRLFRLFRLLDVMRLRSTPVTAASLAVDLGISVRSIYRDIADLQAMGAPIRGEGGLGYVMERGYFLPSLRFEADELDAIILGLKLVHERAAPVLDGAAVRAAAKISSVLGEGQKDSMIDPALEAGPSRTMYGDGNSATYATLRAAISAREFLTIGYRNSRHLRLDRISSVITTGKRFRLERGKRFKDAIDIERGKIALQTPVS